MIFELYFELRFLAGFMFELEIQERKRFSRKGLIYFRLKHETLIIVALSLLFNFGRISGLYHYRKGERGDACKGYFPLEYCKGDYKYFGFCNVF